MTVSDWLKVCLGSAMFAVALSGIVHHFSGISYTLDDQLHAGLIGAIIGFVVCIFLKKVID